MKASAIRDKHIRLDQKKIEKAMEILKAKTETETIAKALELIISRDKAFLARKKIMQSILARRNRLQIIKEDVADWVREGRTERDKMYGG
jgi:hypothetical protein